MNDLFSAPEHIEANGGFGEFWARYPRKVAKGAARKAYAKALKLTTHDEIMFGLSQQIEMFEVKEKAFIPHASTWLNAERWEDEPEPTSTNQTASQQRGDAQFDEARERALRIGASSAKPDPIGF